MGRPKKVFPESELEELTKVSKYGLNQADTAAYFGYSLNTFKRMIEGLSCMVGMGILTETETKTVYGDAPFYWLFFFLIALVGYSIRYILTGNKNPLPWSKENNS